MAALSKLSSIQCLRALAVVMVVIFHVVATEQKYTPHDWLSFFGAVGLYGVDLFFVISGFIITHISLARLGQKGAVREFLLHRAWRIYPVYWVFTLMVLAVYLVRPEMVNQASGAPPDIIGSFLLIARPERLLLAVGWTLTFELYFYLVFSLAYIFGKKSLPAIWLLWAAFVFGMNISAFSLVADNPVLHVIASPLVLEFIAGSMVAYWLHHRAVTSGVVLPALLLAILYVSLAYEHVIGLPLDWARSLLMAVPCGLVLLAALGLEKWFGARSMIVLVGNASYSIYLSHVLVVSAIGRLLAPVWPQNSVLLHGVWLFVSITAAIGFGILSYRFLEKPLLLRAHQHFKR